MVKEPVFRGAATALITPLNKNGVDFRSLGKLIDWQIEQGIDALVIVGTTGEKSTLTSLEHLEVVRYAIERADHRVPIIVGTGSNDTAHAINMSREAVSMGADALLCVTPYYNKATQNGLVTMYETIADSVDKPIILYNVPSRTGVGIEPETYAKLADHPNIAGIKEANGDISKIVKTRALVGDKLALYSGNDDQIVPILSMGGDGVISVLSNLRDVPQVLRGRPGGGKRDAAEIPAADQRPVQRSQPHPREGRHGRHGLLRELRPPAADSHGGRSLGETARSHGRAGPAVNRISENDEPDPETKGSGSFFCMEGNVSGTDPRKYASLLQNRRGEPGRFRLL